MENLPLWARTLGPQNDAFEPQREVLRQAFLASRQRVSHLVAAIGSELPGLTVHDITHLDALWRVAELIAGPDYPINPAEAFVLGHAFLLHDSAHVVAAYEGGLTEIKSSLAWRDVVSQVLSGAEPLPGSPEEKSALFIVLREMHARQARKLPKIKWRVPGESTALHLIPHYELREYFGDLIGEIAESHHLSPTEVAEQFADRVVNPPALLAPATWTVDALKLALLLRTADAAHIDALRAPWFLFALRQPTGISEMHWRFQAKLGQLSRTQDGEIRIASGSSFSTSERQTWWLAFDTARMIDAELKAAHRITRDYARSRFLATGVAGISTPASFSRYVRVNDWEPVDVGATISDVPKIIQNFGGAKLYGDDPQLALRELLQNASDAVHALRALGALSPDSGFIKVSLRQSNGSVWLDVTDSGVGMSRYVLTDVLPDFGSSLWSSQGLRSEFPGLAASTFAPIGKFGIGFFAVFMLGDEVAVTTRRYKRQLGDSADQWLLSFERALQGRPILRRPNPDEELVGSGTRVSVKLRNNTLSRLVGATEPQWFIDGLNLTFGDGSPAHQKSKPVKHDLGIILERLCPSSEIDIFYSAGNNKVQKVVEANDWRTLKSSALLRRTSDRYNEGKKDIPLIDVVELDGMVVGRLAHSDHYFSHARITHAGLRAGELRGLEGILLGRNNSDLARSSALPLASNHAWSKFASQWLDSPIEKSPAALYSLHPFTPDRDLPVFYVSGKYLSEAELKHWATDRSEIKVHRGYPEHDDDEVSSSRFSSDFEPEEDVIFYPTGRNPIAEATGVAMIDYRMRLEGILRALWGVEPDLVESDYDLVGTVGDIEIHRHIEIYIPPDQSEAAEG